MALEQARAASRGRMFGEKYERDGAGLVGRPGVR